jgi:CxxC-x17-CxxC domain-containing protein
MSLQEKLIDCFDCGVTFTFSVEDQQGYQTKGYNNAPKRCPACREARKTRQMKSDSLKNQQTSFQSERRLFPAVCSQCGKSTQVPFEPQTGRPVYCRECFQAIKPGR